MEPIVHFLIPVLVVLALFPKLDRKLVLLLSPLTVIMDLDILMWHRFLLHNVFFVLFVLGLVYVVCLVRKHEVRIPILIAGFFLVSHLILDLGGPGVGMFYPVYDKNIIMDFGLDVLPDTGELSKTLSIRTNPISYTTINHDVPIVTNTGAILLLVAIFGVFIRMVIDYLERYLKRDRF